MARPSFSSLWQEFKAFAFKGNMIDLAVAVVIGTAFSGVINSLVKDIIMPSITYVTNAAAETAKGVGNMAQEASTHVGLTTKPADTQPSTQPSTQPATIPAVAAAGTPPAAETKPEGKKPDDQRPVEINWTIGRIRIGNFVGELINFFLVALAVFLVIVKLLGSVMKRVGGTPNPSEPTTKECPYCLSVIPIKARKCSACTADLPPIEPAAVTSAPTATP
ncbi:MAG TPA: MscL family protein [Tepidisphaeraceae bacterium]|nr:MscL family protein [Tepidisphaeraceae bacterium]